MRNNDDSSIFQLERGNTFVDSIEDVAKNEFEKVMQNFQYLTKKVISFNLLEVNDDNTNISDNRTSIDTSSEYSLDDKETSLRIDFIPPEGDSNEQYTQHKENFFTTDNNSSVTYENMDCDDIEIDETLSMQSHIEEGNTSLDITKIVREEATATNITCVSVNQNVIENKLPITDEHHNTGISQNTKKDRSLQPSVVNSNTTDTSVTFITSTTPDVRKSENNPSKDNSVTSYTFLPMILFEGYADDDKVNFRLLIIDGHLATNFLELFDRYLKECHLDDDKNWYMLLESCIQKKESKLLNSWFKESMHENLSWIEAKSIIMHTFGFQSPRVEDAVTYFFDEYEPVKEEREFQLYFIIYEYAVKGTRFIEKWKFVNPYICADDGLIQYFILNTYCKKVSKAIYNLLHELFITKKRTDTLPLPEEEYLSNGKKFTDVPVSWQEFQDLIDKNMDALLQCEQEMLQKMNKKQEAIPKKIKNQRSIEKKTPESNKSKRRTNMKLVREETQIAINCLTPKQLHERRKRKMCLFCGAVEYTYEHHFLCKGRKKLLRKAKQKESRNVNKVEE